MKKKYKAFISYKHDTISRSKAIAIETALKRYAKPFLSPPIKIFRDEKILVPNSNLSVEITKALEQSDYLIFLATPEAAASVWCEKEIEYWCNDLQRKDDLILVILDGEIETNDVSDSIVWEQTNCLTPNLSTHLTGIPFYIDLRNMETEKMVLEHTKFKDIINLISAKLRNISPEEINDVEIQTHRKNNRLKINTIIGLSVLLIAFVLASVYAFTMSAINKKEALGNSLFSKGLLLEKEDPTKAFFMINEARKTSKDSSISNYFVDLYKNKNFYQKIINTPDYVRDLIFFRDTIIAATSTKLLFFDTQGRSLLEKKRTNGRIQKFTYDKYRRLLYVIGSDSTLQKWSTNGELLKTYKHDSRIYEIEISSNHKIALIDSESSRWKVKIMDENFNFRNEYPILEGHIFSLQFHPKHDSILALSNGYTVLSEKKFYHINFLDINNHTLEELPIKHPPSVVKFSKTGKYLASSGDHHISIINYDTREVLVTFEAHGFVVDYLEFSPDERKLVSSSLNGEIKMWDLEGNLLETYKAPSGSSSSIPISFNTDNELFASSGAAQKNIKLWNYKIGNQTLLYPDQYMIGIKISPSAKYVLSSYFGPRNNFAVRNLSNNTLISKLNFQELHDYGFVSDTIFYVHTKDKLFLASIIQRKSINQIKNIVQVAKIPKSNELLLLKKNEKVLIYNQLKDTKDTLNIEIKHVSEIENIQVSKNKKYIAVDYKDNSTSFYEKTVNSYEILPQKEIYKSFKVFSNEEDTFVGYIDNKVILCKVSGEIISEFRSDMLEKIKHDPKTNLLYVSRKLTTQSIKTKFYISDYSGKIYREFIGNFPDDVHLFDISEDGEYYITTTESGMENTRVKLYNTPLLIDDFLEQQLLPDFPELINE